MRSKTVFTGQHDGFHYEVQNWGFTEGQNDKWCGYVFFTPLNTPKDLWDKIISLPVEKYGVAYSDSWVAGLDWQVTYLARYFGEWIAPYALGGLFGIAIALMLYSAL